MDDAVDVQIPGGVIVDGVRCTAVRLRRLNGYDQEVLLAISDTAPTSAGRELLGRCVQTIGGRAANGDAVAGLIIGDREALLWQLRLIGLGDRLDAVVECQHCSEKLDVDLRVSDLLQPRYLHWTVTFNEGLAGHQVSFRLPTVADQHAVAAIARTDGEAAAQALLARCVLAVDDHPPTDDDFAAIRAAVEERIAALDPQAETTLEVLCPHCGSRTSSILDAADFLIEELTRFSRYLYREVHALAWHYHWSEHEILGLPVDKRRRYLDLIADTVGPPA